MNRILIIDKNIDDLNKYHSELVEDGYEIQKSSTREEGLESLSRDKSLDLVLLGMETGSEGGFQLLRDIRKKQPEIPILLLCEHTNFKRDFRSWLADDYLTKTSNIESLKIKVKEMIEGS
ncbi:MAG: response regulator [candidate division Zixibacteria bacterium]|nr:response regulator [candidate division Zixibacteria bacterium]